MSDQLNIRKASDLDDDQEHVASDTASIHATSSVHVAKKAKRKPSMILRLLDNSLSLKNQGEDDGSLHGIISGDISELIEAVENDITVLDDFWSSIGYSLLKNAAQSGLVALVQVLLKHADKNSAKSINEDYNPLFFASINRHIDVVSLLLEHGLNPNEMGVHDGDKQKCLLLPSRDEDSFDKRDILELSELLLKHGADPKLLFCGECLPLLDACEHNRIDIVKILLDHGTDANSPLRHSMSALSCACRSGYLDLARLLLAYGADVNHVDYMGTPLITAIQYGANNDLIQLLLEHGADPLKVDEYGRSALDCVAEGSEIAQMLINAELEPILK